MRVGQHHVHHPEQQKPAERAKEEEEFQTEKLVDFLIDIQYIKLSLHIMFALQVGKKALHTLALKEFLRILKGFFTF